MPTLDNGKNRQSLPRWNDPRFRVAAAVLLLLAGILIASWVLRRDTHWKRNHDAALEQGKWALDAGNALAARAFFEQAVAFNPYSADAHFELAEIYDTALGNNENALKHYIAGVRLDPAHLKATAAEHAMAALEMIRTGVIEDPLDVASEMLHAANEKSFLAFKSRLGPGPAEHAELYWHGWRKRGFGQLIQRRVARTEDGDFDALLAFAYADGVSMSMHFSCVKGKPWQLTLAFP